MRKRKLDLDALTVTSFDTDAPKAGQGTVHARVTKAPTIDEHTCQGGETCDNGGTCFATCNGTCYGSCAGACGSVNTTCTICIID